eukprot:CAMPEP_0198124574 /NCGR_PEP_ID=MMETSP1442-20131203/40282_1 /TAXON_ID= /ORGANISM="Craspedostauros australis, Strain CCMP3328" /LENGTH=140 /DNA_ID=CAMNT_0043784007 /DNA_START=88 /DNA_END=511 /DNA_ORIENTATION=-
MRRCSPRATSRGGLISPSEHDADDLSCVGVEWENAKRNVTSKKSNSNDVTRTTPASGDEHWQRGSLDFDDFLGMNMDVDADVDGKRNGEGMINCTNRKDSMQLQVVVLILVQATTERRMDEWTSEWMNGSSTLGVILDSH